MLGVFVHSSAHLVSDMATLLTRYDDEILGGLPKC